MDRGKAGTKRSLLVEADGVPVGLAVAGANRNDCKLVAQALASIPVPRPEATAERPQHLCLDKGYDCEEVRSLVAGAGFTVHIRARGEEPAQRKTGQKARRWVALAHPLLDEPLPFHPHPLGQARRPL